MIIGTAGHIDHGKTTLVRALTGVDTDRLPQEKQRGISIELGYAYLSIPAAQPPGDPIPAGSPPAGPPPGEVLGFIDVPGHERLVHTMVAGACGIDFALLVVAADDGVMPQTREHLAILDLLGVSRGAVALTKSDRASVERIGEVRAEVEALLSGTPLAGAPLFAVDARDPEDGGMHTLRAHLLQAAAAFPARLDARLFRLAVDRVFTLSGPGTVATGTVFSGSVATGDTIAIMPAGRTARVRSIHAQNRAAGRGQAGQRCALNLAGIQTSELTRGDWLADARALAPATHIDVRLRLLPGAGVDYAKPLGSWPAVHVHLGTAHRLARLVPLEDTAHIADQSLLAQLVFAQPVCATLGDRFILRDPQAAHTIGGGVVLDPDAPSRRRRAPERRAWLHALENWTTGGGLDELLATAPRGLSMNALERLSGLPRERLGLPADAQVVGAGAECWVMDGAHWQSWREAALAALADFHQHEPDEPGPDAGRLRRMAAPDLPQQPWAALLGALLEQGLVARRGAWLSLPGHSVALSSEDQALLVQLQPLIAAGSFDPPWVRDLAVSLQVPEPRVRQALCRAVSHGLLYQVVHDLFYARERIGELAAVLERIAQQEGAVNAARYRDAVGLGRKRAIQILEFFNRMGYTRRIRDSHVLRPGSGWVP